MNSAAQAIPTVYCLVEVALPFNSSVIMFRPAVGAPTSTSLPIGFELSSTSFVIMSTFKRSCGHKWHTNSPSTSSSSESL